MGYSKHRLSFGKCSKAKCLASSYLPIRNESQTLEEGNRH